MDRLVAQFGEKIGCLQKENETLKLALAKQEILANERLEKVAELTQQLTQLSEYVDEQVSEKSALMKDREDSLAVVENLFAQIADGKNDLKEIDHLRQRLVRSEQVNRDLQELLKCQLRRPNNSPVVVQQIPTPNRLSTLHLAVQTDVALVINKYTQTIDVDKTYCRE